MTILGLETKVTKSNSLVELNVDNHLIYVIY